jgi:hypothetical protein
MTAHASEIFTAFLGGFVLGLIMLAWGSVKLVKNYRSCLDELSATFLKVSTTHHNAIEKLSKNVEILSKRLPNQPPDDSKDGEWWKNQ